MYKKEKMQVKVKKNLRQMYGSILLPCHKKKNRSVSRYNVKRLMLQQDVFHDISAIPLVL